MHGGAADLLPVANTVIFDEAHHLPDLARLFFGQSIGTTQLLELARDVRMAEAQHARESTDLGDAADEDLRQRRGFRTSAIKRRQQEAAVAYARDAVPSPGIERSTADAQQLPFVFAVGVLRRSSQSSSKAA